MVAGLAALEARARKELALTSYPETDWVPRNSDTQVDVLIVGAGQGGQSIAFNLLRERVPHFRIIDQARAGQEGPWRNYARMRTLRTPKQVTGPDLGLPSLTFQAWFEAQHSEAAWRDLGKIPKEQWADYLFWLRQLTGIPVENETRLKHIDADGATPLAVIETPAGETETLRCRKLVLAHGIERSGHWWMPPDVAALPARFRAHTGDEIDFAALKGKRVAVLGAGASAMDNAAVALEAGAARVTAFCRRPELQRVQPFKWLSFAGFFRHFHSLDDDLRWRVMHYLLTLREAFPKETLERVTAHETFELVVGAPWRNVDVDREEVVIETPRGRFRADFVIAGTGFEMDLSSRQELGELAQHIATWGDRYQPPVGTEDARLSAYPYLDSGYRFTEKNPGAAPVLRNIHLFTFGSTMSFGPSGASINAMKFAVPQLTSAVTRDLFADDAELHFEQLKNYQMPEFLLPGDVDAGVAEAPVKPAVDR